MKLSILTFSAFLFISMCASAATIKLKITYNGAAAQGHTVYVLVGGSSLGSGVTDNSGEVDINVSSIPSRNLELKGEKRCNNAEKTWSLSGWCSLDDNNYCHVKMEEPLDEMADGMGLSADMLAAGWGLTCSGSSSASIPVKKDKEEESSSEAPEEVVEEVAEPMMTPQEVAAQRKAQSEQKIATIDAKIARKEAKFEKKREGMEMDEIVMHGLEIEELKTKKELEQIELEEQTVKTTKVMLNKAERTDFKTRKKAKKDRLDEIHAEMKEVKKGNASNGQIKKSEPDEVVEDPTEATEEAEPIKDETEESTALTYADMTDMQLSTEKAKLKGESGKIKAGLKLRGKKMSDIEVTEKEARIEEISTEVEEIKHEQDSRKGK